MRYRLHARLGGRASGAPPFDSLRAVASTARGGWLLAGDSRVEVLAADGEILGEWATARPGWSVTVDPTGEIWVGEPGQIEVFSATGELVDSWRDETHFSLVTALSVTADETFVADVGTRWIHRFDSRRRLLNHLGDRHRKGGFHLPNGVLDFGRDGDGTVVVANPGMHRVERYQPDGEQLGFFGRFDQHDPEGFPGCCNPTNVAVGPDGEIVVSEKAGPRVKVYDREGQLGAVVADGTTFNAACKNMDLAVGADGAIGVVDTAEGSLVVFERLEKPAVAGIAEAAK